VSAAALPVVSDVLEAQDTGRTMEAISVVSFAAG